MQGLPANLLTQNVAPQGKTTDKMNANSSVGSSAQAGVVVGEKSNESKSAFASLFANLLGGDSKAEVIPGQVQTQNDGKVAANAEGQTLPLNAEMAQNKATTSETKIDVLLKNKDQEQVKKTGTQAVNPESVISAEVLKNVNNLIDRTPMQDTKAVGEKAVGEKVAAASTNLDQLLKTLKGQSDEVNVEGETVAPKQEAKSKTQSPLDFLIKESKTNDVGSAEVKKPASNEVTSKLGLSSEDFLSQLTSSKDVPLKEADGKIAEKLQLLAGEKEAVDPRLMAQRQMNPSMKAYGQKQNLLNDNIIRSPKDLLSKDSKMKSSIDELKSPDMKIGAELSQVKDPFIAQVAKQDQTQQNLNTSGSEKVLDLSKMNSSNPTEIIKKISDYIQQSQVANKEQLDLTVKHDSLGQFKIQVNKPIGNNGAHMDMQITTTTTEGHDFFMKHEVGLLKNLSQAGIQLSDLRIVSEGSSSSFAGTDSRQQGNSQYNSQSSREFMSFDSGDSSGGSQRRKELWQEAQNQQRYGA